jgi:hypothetical protein
MYSAAEYRHGLAFSRAITREAIAMPFQSKFS